MGTFLKKHIYIYFLFVKKNCLSSFANRDGSSSACMLLTAEKEKKSRTCRKLPAAAHNIMDLHLCMAVQCYQNVFYIKGVFCDSSIFQSDQNIEVDYNLTYCRLHMIKCITLLHKTVYCNSNLLYCFQNMQI